MDEILILVDKNDLQVGVETKTEVHRRGILHRAFSIFVFNAEEQLLLQKRASEKYHSAGLWSNTCCGHPRPGDDIAVAAHRRLQEEMGFDCQLQEVTTLLYHAYLPNNLIEHEFDHILIGKSELIPLADPSEVSAWKWIDISVIRQMILDDPSQFTAWFIEIINQTTIAQFEQWQALIRNS